MQTEAEPPEIELTAEEQAIVREVERQPSKAFALNHILDEIFFVALIKNDSDVCQNLISAIKSNNNNEIQAVLDIIATYRKQSGNAAKTYAVLKEKLASYKITQWLGLAPAAKTQEQLLDLWVRTVPSLQLITVLQNNGVPTEEQEKAAESYALRQSKGTDGLRRSKLIMLLRSCDNLLFEPGEVGQPRTIKLPTPLLKFGEISDIMKALRDGFVADDFKATVHSHFVVGQGAEQQLMTLDEVDTRMAEIVNDLLMNAMIESQP